MPDIATFWSPQDSRGDWAVANSDLASGSDLETAVLISLFTDRRADPDDVIPDGGQDRRGWWGDLYADKPIGSKLWLLDRSKRTEAVRQRAQGYIADALQWLVDDGVAASVVAVAQWQQLAGSSKPMLACLITITEPDARVTQFNYQWAWGGLS